jgi:CzcA family heavy metal efflux pump
MIHGIVAWSLRSRFLVLLIAAATMLFGITQLRNMPVDVLPEFSPPYVEIQTEALGLSAEEVEQLITVPMEQDLLNGVPWLETIRSQSVAGLSSIVLIFEPQTDLTRARQMVSERLTQAFALPHVSKPPTMLQPLSSTSRVMIVGLSSKSLSLIQMSVLARWTIAPRLMGVPGVANVAIWGQRDRQLQVQVDPKRLQDQGVSLLQVLETAGNALWVSSLSFVEASTPGTGGFIDTANQRLGIRHILPIVSPEGLAQVPVEDSSVRLGDVANVVEDHQPLIGDALDHNGPSLLLVIEKFPGANTLAVTRGVEQALDGMRPGLSGMETDSTVFRPADFIQAAIKNLALSLLLGFVLLALVVGAFFFNWRTALISLAAIVLSLMAAGVVLYLRGATINMILATGFVIAVGVVVDDAIVDVEHIMQRLRQRREEGSSESAASIILRASLEVRSPMIYATVIMLLVITPVFFIAGLSGAFSEPLALSYALAMIASLVVALTVTPALCLVLLVGAPLGRGGSPLVAWLQRIYEPALAWTIRRPLPMFLAIGIVLLAGLAVMPFLHESLLPDFRERNLAIHLTGAPGMSQPEMTRIAGRVSRELESIPGVRNVGAHIGRAVFGDQVVDVNSSELWVSIDPGADYDKTRAAVQAVVSGYPGLQHDVQTYMNERSSQLAAGPNDSIDVRIFGEDWNTLGAKAREVEKASAGVKGVVASHIDLPVQQPTVEVEVDLAAAQRYGIKPGDVRRAAATLVSGLQVGSLFEEQKVFDVVVWSTPATRTSLTSIQNLLVDTPDGGRVRLGDVARVHLASTPTVIQHGAVSRYVDVTVRVKGRSLGAVASEIRDRINGMQFPLEYHAEVLGSYAQRQADQTRFITLVVTALVGVFFLLQAALGSWRLAIASLLTLPVAAVGGLLATRGAISLGSLAGFLMVLGIAVRNGILLMSRYRHLEQVEGEPFGAALVVRGARERLAPILTTTLAVGLAFVPALILGDIPGLEIVRPLAIVVLGCLVTLALLNLFVVPTLYLALEASPARDRVSANVTKAAQDGSQSSVAPAHLASGGGE